MTRPLNIVYFFEDIAHENFVKSIVHRIAGEKRKSIIEKVGNATSGSVVWLEFDQYLRDIYNGILPIPDVLIVVIDGNCKKDSEVRRIIKNKIEHAKVNIPHLVNAIPNPHIERWYLGDQSALKEILPKSNPKCPRYKCQHDRYKKALKKAIRDGGLDPILGGAEYGQDIATLIDLYQLGRVDRSFKRFLDELTAGIGSY
jgi:hypothetical protein